MSACARFTLNYNNEANAWVMAYEVMPTGVGALLLLCGRVGDIYHSFRLVPGRLGLMRGRRSRFGTPLQQATTCRSPRPG